MHPPPELRTLSVAVPGAASVSALFLRPADAFACYVFAHGAGAGMAHPFMAAVADALAARGVATLRFQFPYMERGAKRPDSPAVAQAAVRAAAREALRLAPDLPLFAGGKSFGGRMASQAQAAEPLAGVRGLVFVGFPLHAAGKPSDARGAHLLDVRVPMLFLQGTRDALADLSLLEPLVERLGPRATLAAFEDADHSFHVRAKAGMRDDDVRRVLCDRIAGWIRDITEVR
jgi:predicted alpha/beta-hydrolase family hydrolase